MSDNMRKIFILLLFSIASYAQTGIGTSTPVNKFQIESATADPASSGSAANGNLRLSGLSVAHVLDFGLSSSSTFSWIQARNKTYGTNYNLALNPLGGNVGIGTNSPQSILHVNGGYLRVEYASPVYIDLKHSNAPLNNKVARIGNDNGNLIFDVVNDTYTTSTERMRIDASGNLTGVNTNTLSGFGAKITSISTSYSLAATDNAEVIQSTAASAITITIPTGLPTGFNCMVLQYGAGQITFAAASGVTIINRNSYTKTLGQYAIATVLHLGSNIVVISGELGN
jgi:hypothetical protein